eukprot:TRINITY_DN12865_c0_g1_i1.p1 TRINITY_DN12865_c0_g1~~TRINITY_DN12865_c0_g1_i1.p1  ORF type:complete len:317 (-),score=54.29 TRINITY_DN12865_c0_g1_i1:74-1024(-)
MESKGKEGVILNKEEQDLIYSYRSRLLKASELPRNSQELFSSVKQEPCTLPGKVDVYKLNSNVDTNPINASDGKKRYIPQDRRSFTSSHIDIPESSIMVDRRNSHAAASRAKVSAGKVEKLISATMRENLYRRVNPERSTRIKVAGMQDIESRIRSEGSKVDMSARYDSVKEFTKRDDAQLLGGNEEEVLAKFPSLKKILENCTNNADTQRLPQYQFNELVEKENNKENIKKKTKTTHKDTVNKSKTNKKQAKVQLRKPTLKSNETTLKRDIKTTQVRRFSTTKDKSKYEKLWLIAKEHAKDCPTLAAKLKKEHLF